MKSSFSTAAVAATLVSLAAAKKCQNITVSVDISSLNAKFDQAALTPENDIDVTNFILNLSQQGGNYTADVLQGYDTVSGTYQLATTYCAPDCGAPDVVQVLTHGIGFDRSYWDIPYNNYNYSYSNVAVDQYGFATFSYDRLGIGMSEHGEPVNEIQAMLETQALRAVTEQLRAGSISGVPKFSTVLHVGHSFGSVLSYALSAMYPDLSDGLGLTGFSQNGTFMPFFELGGGFVQANTNAALAQYPNGYLASATASAVQTNFFAPNSFDPLILPFAYSSGEPVTVGELLTIGGAAGAVNSIAAPVLVITGERDVPFCGGNCLAAPTGYTSIPETSKADFPSASPFEVVIVPGTGHGLNLAYSHVFTFNTINEFFVKNGKGPASGSCGKPTGYGGKPTGSMPTGYGGKPTGSMPSGMKPSGSKPSSMKPSGSKPSVWSSKPSSIKPSSMKPSSMKPSSMKPSSIKPSSIKPSTWASKPSGYASKAY